MIRKIKELYTKHLDRLVEKYWQMWHFDMGPEHRSYNNEGDAFKHTIMSAELALFLGQKLAKIIGDIHEDLNPLNNPKERNMDLWNNAQGREIALEIKHADPLWPLCTDLLGIAASKTMNRLATGNLITNPNDPRHFID